MHVIEKPKVFEAVQMQEPEHAGVQTPTLSFFTEAPGWLVRAIDRGVVRVNVFEVPNHPPELCGLMVEAELGSMICPHGHWIVCNKRGELDVMTNAYFKAHYVSLADMASTNQPDNTAVA